MPTGNFKKVFALIFLALYIWFSIMLIPDVMGAYIGDTTLLFLDGQSVGLQGYQNLVSLNPNFMALLFFALTVICLISVKFKFTVSALAISDLIFAVLTALVHYKTLLFEPFKHGDEMTGSYFYILRWVWFVWITFAVVAVYYVTFAVIKIVSKKREIRTPAYS